MVKLIEEGKVRAAGVSNFNVELLERCEAIRHVDSLQPLFSMISRAAAEKLLPWCKNQNTGVICYSPMQSGILTDGFTTERVAKMASDDWRRRGPEFQEPKPQPQSRVAGCAAANRRAARRVSLLGRDRLDAQLAGPERRNRRSAHTRASRRLDSSGNVATDAGRPSGDCRGNRADAGRLRPITTAEIRRLKGGSAS